MMNKAFYITLLIAAITISLVNASCKCATAGR